MNSVELTDWERQHLQMHAASNALTYAQHKTMGGLFPREVEEMERWKALAEKLKAPVIQKAGDKGDAF